jgi:hypothetical protein
MYFLLYKHTSDADYIVKCQNNRPCTHEAKIIPGKKAVYG